MPSEPTFNRVLVVLSPDLVKPGRPQDSVLLRRAVALAAATGCELELFHVCYDSSLEQPFFGASETRAEARKRLADRDATLLEELAVRLGNQGAISITHEVRWDNPRTEAILRKVADSKPDLVMKQSRDHGYVMGLTTNTDWDLMRQLPISVWLVNDDVKNISKILTAVGSKDSDDEIIAPSDYDVFRVGNLLADKLSAENIPVHTYQPPLVEVYGAYSPDLAGMGAVPSNPQDYVAHTAEKHGQAIRTFAEYFNVDPAKVVLAQGEAGRQIPRLVSSLGADLVILGARNLTRWERLMETVTAEPVLANAECDLVIVRNRDDAIQHPGTDRKGVKGEPRFSLEQAVSNPRKIFPSPQAVLKTDDISADMKKRILQVWEYDLRTDLEEANKKEAGTIDTTELDKVLAAMADLIAAVDEDGAQQNYLTG